MPNSARDLIPLLQSATKALAQMLAGRTGSSGQLNQARNLLAHAEGLIAERVHNRLNPAEREEFFEQLARLRLTISDADTEAEATAAEEQVEQPPAAPPVARERLKEMALALSTPSRSRFQAPTSDPGAEPSPVTSSDRATPGTEAGATARSGDPGVGRPAEPSPTTGAPATATRRLGRVPIGARLRLSRAPDKAADDEAATADSDAGIPATPAAEAGAEVASDPGSEPAPQVTTGVPVGATAQPAESADPEAGSGSDDPAPDPAERPEAGVRTGSAGRRHRAIAPSMGQPGPAPMAQPEPEPEAASEAAVPADVDQTATGGTAGSSANGPTAAGLAPLEAEHDDPGDAAAAAGPNGASAEPADAPAKGVRRRRKTKQGLPEGWVIDDEGFVVPGPS